MTKSSDDSLDEAAGSGRKRGGKLRKLLFLGALVAIASVVRKKLSQSEGDEWQSAYVPTPPPAPFPEPPATAEPTTAESPVPEGTEVVEETLVVEETPVAEETEAVDETAKDA